MKIGVVVKADIKAGKKADELEKWLHAQGASVIRKENRPFELSNRNNEKSQAPGDLFRLQGGHRFLECGPRLANKKRTVEHILSTYPWHKNALLVYLGDDDKDEVAFEAIQGHGGVVVAVGDRLRHFAADCWLPSPQAVRLWLLAVIESRA